MKIKKTISLKASGKGVTLLEFVVYLALFLVLISTSFYWVTTVCIPCLGHTKKIHALAQVEAAAHLFAQDIKAAPAVRSKWKKITDSELIWQTAEGDVGWFLKEGAMSRVIGMYSTQLMRWQKRVTGLATSHMHEAHFVVSGDHQYVHTVELHSKEGHKEGNRVHVALVRNRVVA